MKEHFTITKDSNTVICDLFVLYLYPKLKNEGFIHHIIIHANTLQRACI